MSSLESVRIALDDIDAQIGRLRGQNPSPSRDRELAAAHGSRAEMWIAVAELSFDDVVAGDLLARAAHQAASYDRALSCGADEPDWPAGPRS